MTEHALTEDELVVIFKAVANPNDDEVKFSETFKREYNLDMDNVLDALNRCTQEFTGADIAPPMAGVVAGGILLGLAIGRRIHEKENTHE